MMNHRLALGLFGGVLWFSLVAPPYVPRELNLDFAWMLSFAHYHHEGLQAGVDYVFTYGPLGFLASSVYDREILGLKLGWELAFKLGIVLLALRHLPRLSGTAARVLYALALLLLLANQSYPDSGYLCAALLLGIFLIEKAASPGWLALGLPVLWVLGLVKFTLLVFGAGVTGAVAVAALAARGPAHAAGMLVYAALAFAGLWLASDQALANLPVYLSRSAAMASGYDEAMAFEGRSAEIALGVPLFLLNVGWLGGTLLARRRPLEKALVVGLGALALAVSWRHGFVRSGGFHFFAFAGLLPFLLAPPAPRSCVGARLCTGLLAVAVAIATVGLAVANGEERAPRQFLGAWATQFARVADLLRDPPAWKASREQALEALRAHYDLPRVRARVGRETIDVFHYEQGAVLLNGLRWQPRPVPSYATYTPDLLRLNAAFFESDAAPRFVLYRHQTLDDRVPMLDDAAAIQVVLRRYAPVLTERSYLLLERRTEPSADPGPAVVFERAVRLGETVDLRGWRSETLILELEAHYTVRGRIRRVWLRAPPLFLEVEPKRGPRRRMRLVPSMASEGFVVSPWLPSHAAFTNWRSGHETLSIRSFRFMAPGQGFFEPELRVIVRSDPRLAPDATPDLVRFPMLEPQPEHVVAAGPVRFAQVDRGVGLILPAPGELRFRLPAGAFALEASYGVLAAADRATGASAGFRVERVDSLGSHTTLFQRALDPGANPAHRGSHVLRLRVEVDEGGELVMRSEAHPGARPGGAPYWADVHIAPVPIAPGEGAIDGSLQGSSSAPKVRSGPQS